MGGVAQWTTQPVAGPDKPRSQQVAVSTPSRGRRLEEQILQHAFPALHSDRLRFPFKSSLQQCHDPGVHVLPLFPPSHARGLQHVAVFRFVALLRERCESPHMPEEVALFADLHFRVELVVVEPDEAVREGRVAVGRRDALGVLVAHGEADQVVHVPEDRVYPLLGNLRDGLRGEPAADAELAQLGEKGRPVDAVREVLELVHHDGEFAATVRWPAERIDADVVQDRGADEGGVYVADLPLIEIDNDDGVVHELHQGEIRGLVEYGPDDGPDERLQLVDRRRELRHAFRRTEAFVVLQSEVGEQRIVGLRDHPLPYELAHDEQVDMRHRRMLHRFDGGGRGAVDHVRGLEPPGVPGRRFEHAGQGRDVELLLLPRLSAEDRYSRHLLCERVDVDDALAVPLRDVAQDAARARAVRVHVEEGLAGADELDGDVLQERRFPDARNTVHERVVEAVDDEIFFEGERVSVCSDGDVHGVRRPRRHRTGGLLLETAGRGTSNPALSSDWMNRTGMNLNA